VGTVAPARTASSDVRLTMNGYTHIDRESKRDGPQWMDALLREAK